MLVVCCSAMLATAKLPTVTHGGKVADAGIGLLGGVMAPLSGFSGLAPALWATLRGYTKDEHRAVLQNFNLVVLLATFASFVCTGRARAEHLPQMAVVAGSLIVPSLYGSKIYVGMSPTAFRNVVLWLLVLAGVTMLAAALRAMYLSAPPRRRSRATSGPGRARSPARSAPAACRPSSGARPCRAPCPRTPRA